MTDHDPKCAHSAKVQNIIDPVICSFCQVIRSVRREYEQ
jgi:hypothetical protein